MGKITPMYIKMKIGSKGLFDSRSVYPLSTFSQGIIGHLSFNKKQLMSKPHAHPQYSDGRLNTYIERTRSEAFALLVKCPEVALCGQLLCRNNLQKVSNMLR